MSVRRWTSTQTVYAAVGENLGVTLYETREAAYLALSPGEYVQAMRVWGEEKE